MPRRKQGHSKPSATGGYPKKKTDIVTELIENESHKSYITKNDLVFKIKKTITSTFSNSSYHEKIEREHIDATKSLNDKNMVSKYEVNNNLIESMKEQDENSNNRSLTCCVNSNTFSNSKNSKDNGNLQNRPPTNSSLLESNSHIVNCNSTNENYSNREFEKPNDLPLNKSAVCNSNDSAAKLISTNESVSRAYSTMINSTVSSCKSQELENKFLCKKIFDSEKQNSDFTPAQMSGVSPATSNRNGCKTEPQQLNYRVSTSVTERGSNQAKDTVDSVIKEEQHCYLPSSVYGSPASSVKKVLTGLQMTDKKKDNESSTGKVSFLQEILQKKTSESVSYNSLSKQHNSSQKDENICKSQKVIVSDSNYKLTNSVPDPKIKSNSESSLPVKLKLHIPETFISEDSNSSVLSTENSQKPAKIPKITSPQILEQHISKIISENAAIVDTLDPKWSRRYFKQSSLNSSPSDSDSKKFNFSLKSSRSEETLNKSSAAEVSKLQSALLGGSESSANSLSQNVIVSPRRTSSSSNDKISHFNNLSVSAPAVNMFSKACSVTEEESKGNAIKSLLSFRKDQQPKDKAVYSDVNVHNLHPQNPEGSIIKDLLLKSKSKEGSRLVADNDDKLNSCFLFDGNTISFKTSPLRCLSCNSEFLEKSSLDLHQPFCRSATKTFLSLRDDSERVTSKQVNAQKLTDFHTNCHFTENSNYNESGAGPILKKQLLLPLSKSPPLKRRKVSDSLLSTCHISEQSFSNTNHFTNNNKNMLSANHNLLSHRSRSHSVHLFGGEVQINDGDTTKRLKIKTSIPGAFSPVSTKFADFVNKKPEFVEELGNDKDASNFPSVVVTIAQPVHNSGGTVHLPNCRPSSVSPVVTIGNCLSDDFSKYMKTDKISPTGYTKNDSSSELIKPFMQRDQSLLNLSPSPTIILPGPDSKDFYAISSGLPLSVYTKFDKFKSSSVVEESSSTTLKVPASFSNKSSFSPFISSDDKCFQLLASSNKEKENQKKHVVPTVLFTPSSPTLPANENDVQSEATTSISEPAKKFLAPTRPTSLPLKKKPFTMVGSTLISPETPRPKKTCIQLYINGHAYTYLGLKCSTRSTYCCIYRPQPMFVLQETNPKLSMYSNWQIVPAKEELLGLTPGQMISLYCSKQRRDIRSIISTAKVGEPSIFTHSSYWTYRSTDQSGSKNTVTEPRSNLTEENKISIEKKQESTPIQLSNSNSKSLVSESKSSDCHGHFTDESSRTLDTDNTTSDADASINNSDDEDDEDCQDDGTESLTDSSQPLPPKRVKIFEGGFKSNEDYTYVRGRGRGKYVCEECGIRCKKPSMLKKHIRTHTDLRPYKCKHCSFAFKTKGNLTKHMKSKAHHKKCTELGIIPVPTTTDDSQIDEEALAKQEQIEKKKTQFSDGEDADDDDDETDETDDECESDASSMITSNSNSRMLTNGHTKKSSQDKTSSENTDENKGSECITHQSENDKQEAARSLLHLSAIGEPSQWSTSTGDLTDASSSIETDIGSLISRHEQPLLSPQYVPQTVSPSTLPSIRSNVLTDQWLSTETLGHRPRSYSADIPLGGGKELLAKYRLVKGITSDASGKVTADEPEFGSKDQFTRRYSISVAREARKPRVIQNTEWNALGLQTSSTKWPETELSDQPMDLSISRDLGKYKPAYSGGSLLSVVTQEESLPDRHLQSSLDSCLSDQFQLKSLPVLSPQVVVDYDASIDSSSNETPILSLTEDQVHFSTTTGSSASRSMYYVQDVPVTECASVRKEGEVSEDPPSPDIDYSACSPVSPTTLEDNSYYYTQENLVQGSTANEDMQSSFRAHAEFIVPSSSSSNMEEGKCVCRICNKIFAKSSHLRLHVNIHYFERPFRCDNCAVSFRTKGHLQKHKRSVSHFNKVNMNLTFGTPTVDNPRPFKCADCKIAFRIHGHLAKHLRSKMHIMKLECLGKLPFGMYAEMERSGVSLNEIDTTDCNNSLESLQVMAQKLYQRDPRQMRWQGPEHTVVDTDTAMPAPSVASTALEPILPINESIPTAFDPNCAAASLPLSSLTTSKPLSDNSDVKNEPSAEVDPLRIPSAYTDGDSAITLSRYTITQPFTTANQEINQRVDASESDPSVSLNRSGTCHLCGRLFKSAKFLQVHLYSDHSNLITSVSDVPPSNSSVSSVASIEMNCDLCGKMFPNQKVLQQHLLSHAQPRPFVCEICDAGFTSSSSLIAHQITHQTASSQSSVPENRLVQLK